MLDNPRHKRSDSGPVVYKTYNPQTVKSAKNVNKNRTIFDLNTIRRISSNGTLLLSPKVAWSGEKSLFSNTKSKSHRPSPEPYNRRQKLPRLALPESEELKLTVRSDTRKKRTQSMEQIIPISIVKNIVSRCAYKTRVGSCFGRPKKNNQDTFIIYPFLQGVKGQYLFAVCDGHGVYGHDVSQAIKDNLGKCIEEYQEISIDSFEKGIRKCDKLIRKSRINLEFSGSTLISILIQGNKLMTGNIGDSRAVLGNKAEIWRAIELSRDHKPELPDERDRIIQNNGRVDTYYDEDGTSLGPNRVWLSNSEIPGLAMSRSIGDLLAHSCGVSSDPEITTRKLESTDKFIILASDGIWEFISSQEAVDIVKEYWEIGKIEMSCDRLVKEAVSRWQRTEESIDDITVIVIFLNAIN